MSVQVGVKPLHWKYPSLSRLGRAGNLTRLSPLGQRHRMETYPPGGFLKEKGGHAFALFECELVTVSLRPWQQAQNQDNQPPPG